MSEAASADGVSQKRPWLAVALTVLVPGLGHLYIRMWGRALLWFALYFVATTVLMPDGFFPEEFSVEALIQAGETIPLEVTLLVLGISVLCIIDAYRMTAQLNRTAAAGGPGKTTTCPSCGKEVDEDLDFCHWCTTRLVEPESDEADETEENEQNL